ncbi:AIM24 family protein [Methanosalsum natronophilum]|uniref:AIM24 family protein n=1 Tax=Methanosalsum natronophilum TaxID=768733 RepID=A0A424Z502_9EURY|nr:MAG: AIM24 family protein [Methanosalsum natronophilum]
MTVNFYDNIEVIDSFQRDGFKVEVIQYKTLKGSKHHSIAKKLYHIQRAGMALKQIKVTLEDKGLIIERGNLNFHKGNIEMASKVGGVGGLAKKVISSKLNQEAVFKPLYKGTGEVFLEPSFGHFVLYELDNDSIVVDKGLFYCCEEGIEVGVESMKTLSAGMFGGEGWFQTKISGTGICVLSIPVPFDELMKYELENERVQVDGTFALLRTSGIKYSVKRSSTNLISTVTGGEGMLQTFEGTGKVWLAPTEPVYNYLTLGEPGFPITYNTTK